ncbi:FAD-dependent thymidylate synthase [Nocardia grenadensis]|uniref:FAD-dependent thymidylate synthase n=1 Tax=Nocardia grenadensis TaxID=931537 RepID=UPI003D7159E9
MKTVLIAHTRIERMALVNLGYEPHTEGEGYVAQYSEEPADELAEFAGRNCYQSFNRPNPETAENVDYLGKNIIGKNHESVFEHASASFYVDASRSVLTELERHRHLSFSVVSQRYVDASKLDFHYPPALDDLPYEDKIAGLRRLEAGWVRDLTDYTFFVNLFTDAGKPRKKAREAARAVLPNMTSSPMVVSGNHRAWRYVIKARWHEAADAEIRDLAGELLKQLRQIAPNTYQDIPDKPYSYGDQVYTALEIQEMLLEIEQQRMQIEQLELRLQEVAR